MKIKWGVATFLLISVLLLGTRTTPVRSIEIENGIIWTQWDADHYALVGDGEAIWIGTGSGLLRWDKEDGTYTRISTVDGLPHRRVFSAAADNAENLWFGGDGGLSKLATNGEWTHYDTSNSGIFANHVAGIAATADGSVWLSHADSSYVSRLSNQSGWRIYPNRHAAVAQAYATIKETLNPNSLWAVAGEEVWVDYNVFDGSTWQVRKPALAVDRPRAMVGGSGPKMWALDPEIVFSWDGNQWEEYWLWSEFGSHDLTCLTVDKDDRAWVGGQKYNPYTLGNSGYCRLSEKPDVFELNALGTPPPVTALLASGESLWITGPNWLVEADGELIHFADNVSYPSVNQVIIDQQGRTWISSTVHKSGSLQIVDDMGTAAIGDDQWMVKGDKPAFTSLEPAPNGDLWVAWQDYTYHLLEPDQLTRYHGNEVIVYEPPFGRKLIEDIFGEDGQHTWFAYSEVYTFFPEAKRGVWSLDDGGTPGNLTDDIWTDYPLTKNGIDGHVAVVDGKIWYGDSSGLYRYQGNSWEQVDARPVEGLVPGGSGELYVDIEWGVLIVEQDGRQEQSSIPWLMTHDLARVQLTKRRNQMWTVAPDGAVWYWKLINGDDRLVRHQVGEMEIYSVPEAINTGQISTIEIDANNQVWLADGALWRMSRIPDFSVVVAPSTWFMTANDSRAHEVRVLDIGDYEGQIELSVRGVPPGVTVEINPQLVRSGETATLRLTTSNAELRETTMTIDAAGDIIKHQATFTLAVVQDVSEVFLTLVAGKTE